MWASPVILVGALIATLWGAMFHLLFGKTLRDLVLYWFIGLIGFAVGQAMANTLGLSWLMVGEVHLAEGTLACWIAMFVARWLKL